MLDERELENRIERIPAAPGQIVVLQSFSIQPESESAFEALWHDFGVILAAQPGCRLLRLHRDLEVPARFMSFEIWDSRRALVGAIRGVEAPDYPTAGHAREVYVQQSKYVAGSVRDFASAAPGQVVTVRHFYLKVGTVQVFERLWTQSAQSEANRPGSMYKRLHRDLNLPTHYVSYSLWENRSAPEEAAHDHAHWQADHEPYPLASPVIREALEIQAQVRPGR